MSFRMYPPEFYYSEKSDESYYSFSPPGDLNVNKLMSNQAPWKKHLGAIEKKRKWWYCHPYFHLIKMIKKS